MKNGPAAPRACRCIPREAVILASIVEKETALPEERRHIAAVFINRLKAGMKLQTDPTIIYGLTKGYPLGRGIRQSELEGATPYNTYVIAGLPPGPICNPGKDSIAAVLNPEASDDLYFVATGQGGHVFAATISEQARNVAAYRAFERQRQAPEQTPDSKQVEASTRVENPPVAAPEAVTPKLPPVRDKVRDKVRTRRPPQVTGAVARALGFAPSESTMTFASMTGFAESAGSHDGLRWRWEAKSVNGRSLDMRLRTPPGYDGLEPPARGLAGERFLRGAFQISLTVEPQETARGLTVDAVGAGQRGQDRARGRRRDRPGAGAGGRIAGAQGRDRADEAAVPMDPVARAIATPPSWKAWPRPSTGW